MKLLHSEVDVVPGRRAQQPGVEGTVGPGSAILRLQNTSAQENAYTVRLRSDAPYWQDAWHALRALPPPAGDGAPTTGKADQYGPNDRWVKVFVSRGGTRDLQILFDLPEKPDARAGLYPFTVSIETHVGEAASTGRGARSDRFVELPATAIVRPFYRWSLDVTPEERRVGILRRSSEFEVVVTNQGNDWLYCDLKLPRNKDLLLDAPTLRLAVPPPEPGDEQFQRAVPLRSATKLKVIRGAPTPLPIPLTATRVNAPSVPPLPEAAPQAAGSANTGASVLAEATGEVAQAPSERALLYCPPVPTTLTGFIGGLVQNGRTLVFTLLGMAALVPFLLAGWERYRYNGVTATPDPQVLSVAPEGKLPIFGSYLSGSLILIKADGKIAEATPRITRLAPPSRQRAEIELPKDIGGVPLKDGKKIQIAAQRLGFLPFLRPILPKSEFSRAEVTVGQPPIVIPPVEERVATTGGRVKPGDWFRIAFVSGPPLPQDKEKGPQVLLGGSEAEVENWDGKKIVASVPTDAPAGSLPVEIVSPDGGKIRVNGTIEVVTEVASNTTGGATGGTTDLGTGGGTTGGATGTGTGGGSTTGGSTGGGTTGGSTGGGSGGSTTSGGTTGGTTGGTPPTRLNLPEISFNALINKDYRDAQRRADQLLRARPNSADGLALRAFALARQGQQQAALSALQSANRLTQGKTGRARALTLAAFGVLFKSANADKAREYFQEAQKADPSIVDVLQNDEM